MCSTSSLEKIFLYNAVHKLTVLFTTLVEIAHTENRYLSLAVLVSNMTQKIQGLSFSLLIHSQRREFKRHPSIILNNNDIH